ncbi:X-ray repair cross-complementing protein 5 [Zootermopsis nevadensis]|uniref:ATP-dependent DNA helicase II subunit 2 n=1 Tax=Zootermopsis nevadensis TaxID=136037 RepID=A0A067QUA1_ZOONE|nr:X-ray repair cross-complementing protein 5 [Zootermopsis nevadensis]KDR13452.1 ATP-dependent DNA helicase 2 subunit 2 [Zootermopsis nevadensis]
MARSQKEAIVIIVDVGHSISSVVKDKKMGFLENARQCVSMILKRKIFANLKDEVALILLGSEETNNNLNYKNISVAHSLGLPSWEMVQFVEDLKETVVDADWIDAIVVAVDFLKEETVGKKFSERKVVLLSNLDTTVSEDQVDTIIKAVKSEEVNLIAIGPDVNLSIKQETMDDDDGTKCWTNGIDAEKSKTKQQLVGESLLYHVLRETDGVICSFSDAVPQLMYFQKRNIRPTPWNVVMDIGPDIRIAVSGYRKITPATLPSWKTSSSLEEGARVESETSYIRQDENQTVIDRDDVIEGFSFGTTLVPFSDVDKAMMSYNSGDKCFSVLGFTKLRNVPRHLFMGRGILYITAQRGDSSAEVALSSLIHALDEEKLVAIARKVYRINTKPVLGALFPRIASEYECLVFIELPYSEDMREFVFPPIVSDTNKPTKEQLDSVDALIDIMDLQAVKNEYGEVSEAFKSKSVVNPYHQHVYHSLAYRAMNPDAEIPPVNDYVINLLKSPHENKASYKVAVEEIKKQFQLNEVKSKMNHKSAAEVFKKNAKDESDEAPSNVDLKDVTMASLVEATVVEVGTVRPIQDFKALLERGEDFNKVCSQMQKVILNLVIYSFGADNFVKAEMALQTLRETCIIKDPSLYNDWVVQFRDSLFERDKRAFWDILVKAKLGLISSQESAESSVTDDDARKFLEYEESKELEAAFDDDMDADDLLNQM